METYGRECLHNFRYFSLQTEYLNLLERMKCGDYESGKMYYFAEIPDSTFQIRQHSNGSTFYEVSLSEKDLNLTKEYSNSSDINSGDFVFKINPSQSENPPIYIKISQDQIISEDIKDSVSLGEPKKSIYLKLEKGPRTVVHKIGYDDDFVPTKDRGRNQRK